eukprot:TRINITY_DN18469_c0_g1_i1.p1 TRINITY_DN18469_c0_g1~~TRINITY_DN18469_c0_g1_i1.p1  ORF type:complete len:282 (-),score=61.12 TRINITY_DN18469_c0_g1_i1:182-1027(-)
MFRIAVFAGCLASCLAQLEAQPQAIAAMMAGQVANVVGNKLEKSIEKGIENGPPQKCVGPACCPSSSCMNVPGMHCAAHRGLTRCVGSAVMPVTEGMCQCVKGACNADGVCMETIGLTEQEKAAALAAAPPVAPAPAQTPAPQTPAYQNPNVNAAPMPPGPTYGGAATPATPATFATPAAPNIPVENNLGAGTAANDLTPDPGAGAKSESFIDKIKGLAAKTGLPPLALAGIALILANVLVFGVIYCVKRRRSSDYDSEDEERGSLMKVGSRNMHHRGPGH